MRQWTVTFEENGGEYYGSLVITADRCEKTGECQVTADGVVIDIDERIDSIEQNDWRAQIES